MSATTTTAVKTVYGDDIRRFTLEHGRFSEFLDAVRAVYPAEFPALVFRYRDDEGDDVRIARAEEFEEALRVARSQKPPVLRVSLAVDPAAAAASSAAPTPSPLVAALSPPATATSPPPQMPLAPATRPLSNSVLNDIQEKIAANLAELRNLSASLGLFGPAAPPAQQSPQPAASPPPIVQSCNETARNVADKCVTLIKDVPQFVEVCTTEISRSCKALVDQIGSAQQYAADVSESRRKCEEDAQDTIRACSATCGDSIAPAATRESRDADSDQVSKIDFSCQQLVQETRTSCDKIAETIANAVLQS